MPFLVTIGVTGSSRRLVVPELLTVPQRNSRLGTRAGSGKGTAAFHANFPKKANKTKPRQNIDLLFTIEL